SISLSGLAAPITASWAQMYHLESATYDTSSVQVRKVGGASPTTLFQFLDATMTTVVGAPPATIEESAGWGLYSADISSYAGNSVELRFNLTSDVMVDYSGLGVDDVTAAGCCTAQSCNDGNLCTTDVCDPQQGCIHVTDPSACNDNNVCTTDTCVPATGQCSHAAVVCNDQNACTDDACVAPTQGCVFTADNTNTCTDNNLCTSDLCQNGKCVSTPSVVCNDQNACT